MPEKKCSCASQPALVPARWGKKMPTKHWEIRDSKHHPAIDGFFGSLVSVKTSLQLIRCKICGQHWQVDCFMRSGGWTSYPDIAIKIDDIANWQRFDDSALRAGHFPHYAKGIDGRPCVTLECRDMAVIGFERCANCESAAR
jgi:hypothetical protein